MNAILAVAVTLMQQVAAARAPDLPLTTVALVETYADGRVNYELTSAKPAWMWTPYFPRLSGWQPTPAVPTAKALKLARVLVGRDVKVDVSVLAPTLQDEIAVTTVMVRPGGRVMVDEIRKYGIAPVELSLAETAPMTPYRPTVVSVTPNVEVADVSLLTAPYPGYRITVRNLPNKAVVDFHVLTLGGLEVSMPHPIRGLLIGPVVAPIAYWMWAMAAAWVRDFRLSWFQALREFGVIAAFGLPIAYAAAFVWGAPVVYALHRFGWLNAATVIVAGAIGGTVVALWLAFDQQGSFFLVQMPLPEGAVLGALVGGTCWWAGKGKAKHNAAAA